MGDHRCPVSGPFAGDFLVQETQDAVLVHRQRRVGRVGTVWMSADQVTARSTERACAGCTLCPPCRPTRRKPASYWPGPRAAEIRTLHSWPKSVCEKFSNGMLRPVDTSRPGRWSDGYVSEVNWPGAVGVSRTTTTSRVPSLRHRKKARRPCCRGASRGGFRGRLPSRRSYLDPDGGEAAGRGLSAAPLTSIVPVWPPGAPKSFIPMSTRSCPPLAISVLASTYGWSTPVRDLEHRHERCAAGVGGRSTGEVDGQAQDARRRGRCSTKRSVG